VKISLWATNLGASVSTLDEWLSLVEAKLVAAKESGSSLLVMPEFACAQWLSFADGPAIGEELAWLAERASSVLPALASFADKHGIGLLAGTMPARTDHGSYTNRAVLALPEGTFFQDKLALTPRERNPDGWQLEPGAAIRVVRWGDVRIAIAICLDVEVPALAAQLCNLDLDLLLVPSMTSSHAGNQRVFGCAKARAIELCCPVAAVGAIGTLVLPEREDGNVSGAAVFVPCEPAHEEGIVGSLGPFATSSDHGPVLDLEVPIEECRRLRRGGAEVWPPRLPADLLIEETQFVRAPK
jgi:predicted amidohydrolase